MIRRTAARTNVRAAFVWTVIGVYAVAIGVHVMAPSSVRRALLRPAEAVALPFFKQRWNLFAPRPPSANLFTYMLVRYRQDGTVRTSSLIDLSSAVRRDATARRWAPTHVVRVVTKYNVAFEAQANADVREAFRRGINPSRRLPAPFAGEIARRRARDLTEYGRVLSAAAPAAVPAGATILGVRGLIVRTAVVPFAQRRSRPPAPSIALADPDAPPALIEPGVVAAARGYDTAPILVLDSGWLPYDGSVARVRT